MPRFLSFFRNLMHRDRVERDLDDELRAMFDVLVAEKVRDGMTQDEARRAATLELGRVEALKEQVRDARAGAFLETLLQDVRYSARLLRRNPLFATTAALSLAIGIGANTTIFTVANALLFRAPTGVVEPDRLVDMGERFDAPDFLAGFNPVPFEDYEAIRERSTTLQGVYAHPLFPRSIGLGTASGAERIFGNVVTSNYFTVLGARPVAGRLFDSGDADPSVVVLSHRFWTRRFNRNPSIVGQTVRLNGSLFTVTGVATEGFQGTGVFSVDAWIPMDGRGSVVIGARLKPGVSTEQASQELNTIAQSLAREHPDRRGFSGFRVLASSPLEGNRGPIELFIWFLMSIVTIVLIIACANLAGILMARAAARRREIAVRMAIGAGRMRLVRQLLTETVMLFALGGAAGLLLARGMTSLLVSLMPALPMPVEVSFTLDSRVIGFTSGLAFVAAVLSGLVPALQTSKADVLSGLKGDSSSPSGRHRARSVFVVAQVALSVLLVIVGGLFVRALQQVASTDAGFDPRGVETASVNLSLAGYTDATGPAFARELLDRVRALPRVQSATMTTTLPLASETLGFGVAVGSSPPDERGFSGASGNVVEPEYFGTMRIPLLAGRDFSAADRTGSPPVAIVGEAAARRFWPRETPIGRYLFLQGDTAPLLVVGVARDVKYSTFDEGPVSFVYLPLQQRYNPTVTIVARSAGGDRLTREIRALVSSMNPNLPIITARTLDEATAVGLVPQRVVASVSGSLGVVGLLLAAIGIFGITAYTVVRRTREFAIRLALGAQRAQVMRMVLKQGMSLAVTGAAIGLTLAALVSQLLVLLLFGVSPLDPVTFGGAAIVLVAIALMACYVPVRRATQIRAMEALRYE